MYHKIVLETIQESKKLDTCKIVDSCSSNLNVNDLKSLFGITNQAQWNDLLKTTNELFEARTINWRIVNDIIFRRKTVKSFLQPNKIIEEMIDLVKEKDKII